MVNSNNKYIKFDGKSPSEHFSNKYFLKESSSESDSEYNNYHLLNKFNDQFKKPHNVPY